MSQELCTTPECLALLNKRQRNDAPYAYPLLGKKDLSTPNTGYGQYGLDVSFDVGPDIDESRMSVRFPYASGVRRDGVGDLLEVSGINTERHRLNPVCLYDHSKSVSLPCGLAAEYDEVLGKYDLSKYTNVIDPATKTATVTAFFYRGKGKEDLALLSPEKVAAYERSKEYEHALFCEQLFDMIVKGLIRSGSIGYSILHAKQLPPDYETGAPAGMHLLSVLMLEASVVVMPANMDTVRKALATPLMCGKRLSPYLVKSLQPYVPQKKAQLGYEGKSASEKDTRTALIALAKEAYKRKRTEESPDYGRCFYKDETGEVWYVTADGDSREFTRWLFPAFEKIVGKGKVKMEAETPPKKKDGSGWELIYDPQSGSKSMSVPVPIQNLPDTKIPHSRWKPGAGAMGCKELRKKYRTAKGFRRRLKRSSPGSSVVHVAGKDLEQLRTAAEAKGVRFERIGTRNNLERVKLTGDDSVIDELARQHGTAMNINRKSLDTEETPTPTAKQAKDEGKQAWKDGVAYKDNPYQEETGEAWSDGWKQAQKEANSKNKIKDPKKTAKSPSYFASCKRDDKGHCKMLPKTKAVSIDTDAVLRESLDDLRAYLGSGVPSQLTRAIDKLRAIGFNTDIPLTKQGATTLVEQLGAMGIKSLQNHKGKSMPADADLNGDGIVTEQELEKYSAQVLRRLHEDASILLEDYDAMRALLENEEIDAHVVSRLEAFVEAMDGAEALMAKHHPSLPPLGQGAAEELEAREESKEIGHEEQESEDAATEENTEVGPEDEAAVEDASGDEEQPTAEEAVEGMAKGEEEFENKKSMRIPHSKSKDASGHEHGKDGKFTSTGGGGSKKPASDRAIGSRVRYRDDAGEREGTITNRATDSRGRVYHVDLGEHGATFARDDQISDVEDKKKTLAKKYGKKCACGGKCVKCKTKPVAKVKGMCPACGKSPCICTKKKAVDNPTVPGNEEHQEKPGHAATAEDIPTDVGNEAEQPKPGEEEVSLAEHEHAKVGEAATFLKSLTSEHDFRDEHRMKSYHFHKSIDPIATRFAPAAPEIDMPTQNGNEGMPMEGGKKFPDPKTRLAPSAKPWKSMDDALEEKSIPGDQQWIQEEAAEPEHMSKSMQWHKCLKGASDFFRSLANERNFGDPHRAEAAVHHKMLDAMTQINNQAATNEVQEGGEMGEIGEKAMTEEEAAEIQNEIADKTDSIEDEKGLDPNYVKSLKNTAAKQAEIVASLTKQLNLVMEKLGVNA